MSYPERMAKRMGRPKKLPDASAVYVLVPQDTLDGLDMWVEELRESQLGMSGITRADLIRDILARALADRKKPGRRR